MTVQKMINKWLDILYVEWNYWYDEILSQFDEQTERRTIARRIIMLAGDILFEIIDAWEVGELETKNFENSVTEFSVYVDQNIDSIDKCANLQWLLLNVGRDLNAYLSIKAYFDSLLYETNFSEKSIALIKICYYFITYLIGFLLDMTIKPFILNHLAFCNRYPIPMVAVWLFIIYNALKFLIILI